MFDKNMLNQDYSIILQQVEHLLEPNLMITNMANISSLLYHSLKEVNWVGFYLLEQERLVLGPFQGLPACTIIPIGKGVCGTAIVQRKTLVVEDVHAFPGHIACDSASNSEIVIPVFIGDALIGVLDIDSPIKNRFSLEDQKYLEKVVELIGGNHE